MKVIARNIGRYLLVLSLFILTMLLSTLFGKKGLISIYHLNQEREQLIVSNEKLGEENRKLEHKIRLLREDPRYIEKIAREELGLVKEREIVYQFEK
jgi:cell division protein FtsB